MISGTHLGELLGVPATRKEVQMTGITMFRLEGGKIAEIWSEHDVLGLFTQLGVVSPPVTA